MPTTRKGSGRRRTVVRRTIIEEEPETEMVEQGNWFRRNPVLAGVIGVFVLIFLFAPLFTVTKTVQTTETVMVPVASQQEVPTTGTKSIKVYVGFICDAFGSQYAIDAPDAVVELRQTRDAQGNWTLTLVDYYGGEVVYRSVTRWDLTRTGALTVPVSTMGIQTVKDLVPQQVTKEKEVKVRVSFFQWLFGSY